MASAEVSVQVLQLLGQHFELPANEIDFSKGQNENRREQFVQALTPVVRRMLDVSFGELLQVLYRIDLSERQVAGILEKSPPDQVAQHLSKAIVDRQFGKVEMRERYRNQGSGS
jgi:hypothetical protein